HVPDTIMDAHHADFAKMLAALAKSDRETLQKQTARIDGSRELYFCPYCKFDYAGNFLSVDVFTILAGKPPYSGMMEAKLDLSSPRMEVREGRMVLTHDFTVKDEKSSVTLPLEIVDTSRRKIHISVPIFKAVSKAIGFPRENGPHTF